MAHDVFIEVSTHRQPLKGKLVLVDDPLLLSDSKSNPRFRVQETSSPRVIFSVGADLTEKEQLMEMYTEADNPSILAEWLEFAVAYRAQHLSQGALLGYNGSG